MRFLNETNISVLARALKNPVEAFRLWQAGFGPPVDSIYWMQGYWRQGRLPRVPINDAFPDAVDIDVQILRACDRLFGRSITIEELSCLLVIAKSIEARSVLEIGTWDGNTAVNLAANIEGFVTAVDLEPDRSDTDSSVYEGIKLNLTPRQQLGRQFRDHSEKVRQVYGDSALLDWIRWAARSISSLSMAATNIPTSAPIRRTPSSTSAPEA